MNKSESKYFHTALLMDEALLALLEKKILPTSPSRKSVKRRASTDRPFIFIMKRSAIW